MYPKYGLTVEQQQTKNIIYKITFYTEKGDKYYIGQTNQSLNTRLKNHIVDSIRFNNTPIHRAIRKYGLESCKIEIIDHATNRECLNKKEIFWIKYYRSFKECGYNCSEGGGGIQGFKRTKETLKSVSGENNVNTTLKNSQVYEVKKLLFEGNTPVNTSKITGVNLNAVYKIRALRNWVDVGVEFNEHIVNMSYKQEELSSDVVEAIKIRLSNGESLKSIKDDFKLDTNKISRIRNITAFKDIRADLNENILSYVKKTKPIEKHIVLNIKRDLCSDMSPVDIHNKYGVSKEKINRIKTLTLCVNIHPEFNEYLKKFKKNREC